MVHDVMHDVVHDVVHGVVHDERGVERCGLGARVGDIDGVQSGGHKPTTTAFPLEERIKKLNKRRRKKSKKTKKSEDG